MTDPVDYKKTLDALLADALSKKALTIKLTVENPLTDVLFYVNDKWVVRQSWTAEFASHFVEAIFLATEGVFDARFRQTVVIDRIIDQFRVRAQFMSVPSGHGGGLTLTVRLWSASIVGGGHD